MRSLLLLTFACIVGVVSAQARRMPSPCADPVRVSAAARRALTALGAADPAARRALRGCARAVTCGSDPAPTRTGCTLQLMPEDWGYRVTVRPRPANGAPAEMQVNVDTRQDTAHAVHISRNRWAVGRGVAIVGLTDGYIHTHGGEAARIGLARFRVWNDTGSALPVTLLDGVFLDDSVERPLTTLHSSVTSLPLGESELTVGFPAQDAYQSWNDHFAARVRLRAGEQALTPQAEFSVSREEAVDL